MQNLRTAHGYILIILQHLVTNLCSFTHSKDALSNCGVGFRSSCLDQNLVYSWNHPLMVKITSQ
jgi:hypothetical protein